MPPFTMTSPLLALLLAVQASNPTNLRERPLPEGMQWLNLGPVRYRDTELRAQAVNGADIRSNLPEVGEYVVTPFMTEYSLLKVGDLSYDGMAIGTSWDFNAFRLSADFFFGDWEGEGTLRYSTGMQPETVVDSPVEGDSLGMRFAVEWPAVRYLSPSFEVDFGPAFGVNWQYLTFESPPASPFPFSDTNHNAFFGSLGPRLSVRWSLGQVFVALEAEIDWLFDTFTGREDRVGIAVGYRF